MDRLGGRGGCIFEEVGDAELKADVEKAGECDLLKRPSSSSQPPTDFAPEIDLILAGAGMWLGVLGLVRGVAIRLGVIAREGVWA